MSFFSYFSNIYTLGGLASLLLTVVFALKMGGPAERAGVAILIISNLGEDLSRAVSGQLAPIIIMFAFDAFQSAGFLYVAVRYSSLWLGAAMMFQAAAFTIHAMQMGETELPRWHGMVIYLLVNNVLNYLILLSLVGGTCATILIRRRAAREKARAAALAGGRRPNVSAASLITDMIPGSPA